MLRCMEIVLISGLSGSGKSVALHLLEDAGYYCVDNLPPELLQAFVELKLSQSNDKVAIAMDARSAQGLPQLPEQLEHLCSALGIQPHLIFLDASTSTLIRRFSETRRRHPLSPGPSVSERQALVQEPHPDVAVFAALTTILGKIGIEHIDDLIDDLDQALAAA